MNPFQQFCPLLASIPTTESQVLWSVIEKTLPWNILALIALVLWIAFEYKTVFLRRSKNGKTKLFNQFVGSATYFGTQALLPQMLALIFGNAVYCALLPLAAVLHGLVFLFTRRFLRDVVKFWIY